MTAIAYTANPGAPLYSPPRLIVNIIGGGGGVARAHGWKPTAINWRGCGQVSTATISYFLGYDGFGIPQEQPEIHATGTIVTGDEIVIMDPAGGGREWFRGNAALRTHLIQADDDREILQWTLYGPEQTLDQTMITGQWVKKLATDDAELAGTLTAATAVRSSVWTSEYPCIFNEDNKPNATQWDLWKLDASAAVRFPPTVANNGGRVFEGKSRTAVSLANLLSITAVRWTVLDALRALVEYWDRYETVLWEPVLWSSIQAVVGNTPLGEVSVRDISLLQAIQAVLSPSGFGFYLEPWSTGPLPKHRLRVFHIADGSAGLVPEMAAPGVAGWPGTPTTVSVSSAAGRRAVIKRLNFSRDAHQSTPHVRVRGSRKWVQMALDFGGNIGATDWDLVPMWDLDLFPISAWHTKGKFYNALRHKTKVGGYTFAERYHIGGSQYSQYKSQYRDFTLNEDGIADQFLPVGHAKFDPATFDLDNFAGLGARVPRRPHNLVQVDSETGKSISPYVEIGLVDTSNQEIQETFFKLSSWRIDRAGRCIISLTKDAIGQGPAKTDVAWRPWATSLGGEKLPVSIGSLRKYEDIIYMDVLENAIQNTQGTYRLVIRLWCSLLSDDGIVGTATSAHSRWLPSASRMLSRDTMFLWKTVRPANNAAGASLGLRDDGLAASVMASDLAGKLGTETGHASIILRYLSREYSIGRRVSTTTGRPNDMSLARLPSLSAPVIRNITWKFGSENQTELNMDSAALSLTNPSYRPANP